MDFSTFNSPRLGMWQARMARVPRWGWIAIFVGVILPIVVLGAGILLLALLSGLIVFAVVAVLVSVLRVIRGLARRPVDDGRRNVRIVVQSARVIDP